MDFNLWRATNVNWPKEGIAIRWMSPTGEQIDGCLTYHETEDGRRPVWLPLVNSVGHKADVPIKYLPALWRYV